MWGTPKAYELGEVLELLDPRHTRCVRRISRTGKVGSPLDVVVECSLPLDVETAVGLQIVGDRAVADPDLELTILARLGEV